MMTLEDNNGSFPCYLCDGFVGDFNTPTGGNGTHMTNTVNAYLPHDLWHPQFKIAVDPKKR